MLNDADTAPVLRLRSPATTNQVVRVMVASRLFLHPSSCSHLARWAGNPLNRSVIWPTQTPRITPTCNLLHAAPLAASPSASRPGQHRRLCHTAAAVDHAVASPTDQPLGYRQNVGVCLVNRDGLVFAARWLACSRSLWGHTSCSKIWPNGRMRRHAPLEFAFTKLKVRI